MFVEIKPSKIKVNDVYIVDTAPVVWRDSDITEEEGESKFLELENNA